jgi:hypothetical protein
VKTNSNKPPLPEHLSHKPLFAISYEGFDEYTNRENGTDVAFISVGLPEFNEEGGREHQVSSVKIFRHSGLRWSRQSEEIPSARLVDAAIVLALSLDANSNTIKAGTFVGQEEDEQAHDRRNTNTPRFLETYQKRVKRRLQKLSKILKDLEKRKILDIED